CTEHPFGHLIDTLQSEQYEERRYFNPQKLSDVRYEKLPFCMRVLLESTIRKCDGFYIKTDDVSSILDWQKQQNQAEIAFSPARVLLQDFTGIPAMVDLAAMRDALAKQGVDPNLVNPRCPTDLIVDHSLQIDYSKCHGATVRSPACRPSPRGSSSSGSHCAGQRPGHRGGCTKASCSDAPSGRSAAVQIENTPLLCPFHLQPVSEPDTMIRNQEMELIRNKERLQFFKWCSKTFKNINVVPPDINTVHQLNLEYLCQVVQEGEGFIYPDSVVGTDSHTTMINGLGILGWGVGGIESEAVMLGQPVSLTLPQVVGCKLVGTINPLATSIDTVLGITKHLRQAGIGGKFVEFFGPGVQQLSAPDRTTIANMCPEYNATVSFFPVDDITLQHFKHTSTDHTLVVLEDYLKSIKLFRSYGDQSEEPQYSEVIEMNLSSIVPHVSGPKRPQDRVAVTCMKEDFINCLNEKVNIKLKKIFLPTWASTYPKRSRQLRSRSCTRGPIAPITCLVHLTCMSVICSGLLAKKAVEAGLMVKPYIRTSLVPGSGTVTHYLNTSGVLPYLRKLGFEVVGYGCATCVGNTAPLPESVVEAIKQGDLVACGVLSGNRHLEGRLCDCIRANYLASPPLVMAYAIAGTVSINLETEPLGVNSEGKDVYLRDIWPSKEEVNHTEENIVIASMFKELRSRMEKGSTFWNSLESAESALFPWDPKSTYIRCPSFFSKLVKVCTPQSIEGAYPLLFLGDKVTTDHISPAGSIARVSAAAKYLQSKRLTPREFNSYGARRGNDAVMTRGTFASIKLQNRLIGKTGPKTLHIPSGQMLDVFEAAERYQRDGVPLIILAGKEYGSGSSRDWAAKGPYLLGVRAVIAESFEKIHRNHLVGMGIAPLQFLPGQNADSLELCGKERFTINIPQELIPRQQLIVQTSTGKSFSVMALFENDMDVAFFRHGGILKYVARSLLP
uniref:Iron-responsive element-binding protein 2-like n=1 Tax=Sinocyclocheilus rhinocerous TaxID=307959 RepID=A0A673J584_9TELE